MKTQGTKLVARIAMAPQAKQTPHPHGCGMQYNSQMDVTEMEKNQGLTSVYKKFAELLRQRFAEQKELGNSAYRIEEDTIRYFFFIAAITDGSYSPSDFWLEGHVYKNEEEELDALIKPKDGKGSVAIEFKYNRLLNEQTDGAKTDNAGNIYKDLNRLAHLSNIADKRLFIYVANDVMKNYFSDKESLWSKFVETIPLEEKMTSTISFKDIRQYKNSRGYSRFYNKADGDSFDRDFSVTCVYKDTCGENKFLYIFEVQ